MNLLLYVMVNLNHSRVIPLFPLGGTQGYFIQDGSHGLQAKASGNLAQHICHGIIPSLLVL